MDSGAPEANMWPLKMPRKLVSTIVPVFNRPSPLVEAVPAQVAGLQARPECGVAYGRTRFGLYRAAVALVGWRLAGRLARCSDGIRR